MAGLVVNAVGRVFQTRDEPLVVLRECTLAMTPGQSLAIVGPSGSGKSTLLHILGTLDRPTSGSVSLAGQDPFALADGELAAFRNQRVGFVFQDHHLLPQCAVLENVLIPAVARHSAAATDVDWARELVERVGLGHRVSHRPAELSGGERQRVAIARALLRRPALLLADEPTGNLDRATAEKVANLLIELHTSLNTMMVLVTHSPALAARMERRMEILEGHLVPLDGSMA